MFKGVKWRSEGNKVKVLFKLQFHLAKVPSSLEEALTVFVVPAEGVKPSTKSDKSLVRDGSFLWENPVYETVKFNVDMKTGKFHRKIYNFVVSTGSSKSGVFGEASLDFSRYVNSNEATLVSLPLKSSKAEAVLNVSIQKMPDSDDQRVAETEENVKSSYKDHSLRSQLSNEEDIEETVKSNCDVISYPLVEGSSGSDLTVSSSGSSSGVEIPWQPDVKSNRFHNGVKWEWLGDSILEASTENFTMLNLDESSDIAVEKLKAEVSVLSRQMEMSELELQNLRKQIVKESKKGQELYNEVVLLKEERDSLRLDCEKLKVSERYVDFVEVGFEANGYKELREELNHEKELNSNLRIQLRKTQESNSELILAVQDLDEMLEQKNRDLVKLKNGSSEKKIDENLQRLASTNRFNHENEDKNAELEIYKRDKEELEMQIEQLALDYEITKQENHEMVNKIQQILLREQLKVQYECCPTQELESQIEKLEQKLKIDSVKITDLEAHIKILEDEFNKQTLVFEAHLDDAICSKVKQEQRAIIAEEALKKMRLYNASTAERIQEEFRMLSVQMTSSFEANDKVAKKAIAEANELRMKIVYLENSESENKFEKEKLAKQVVQLRNELKKKEDTLIKMEKKLKDSSIPSSEAPKSSSRNLNYRIKGDVKSKETALETSNKAHLEKEKYLLCKIKGLEENVEKQELHCFSFSGIQLSNLTEGGNAERNTANSEHESQEEGSGTDTGSRDDEMKVLKEKSKLMEEELREMQERYSEISVKFAEVEGERQELVMKVRNLKNAQKAC